MKTYKSGNKFICSWNGLSSFGTTRTQAMKNLLVSQGVLK